MTRRYLFQRAAAVIAGTVLAKMPLAGKTFEGQDIVTSPTMVHPEETEFWIVQEYQGEIVNAEAIDRIHKLHIFLDRGDRGSKAEGMG